MRRVDAEARDDVSHVEGGRAILVLRDIDTVPNATAVLLRPQSTETTADTLGLLKNPVQPLSAKIVDGALELLVGPDVTEHPLLLPGTPVEIELPDGEVWSEFYWPQITPRIRLRRKTTIIGKTVKAANPIDEGADRSQARAGAESDVTSKHEASVVDTPLAVVEPPPMPPVATAPPPAPPVRMAQPVHVQVSARSAPHPQPAPASPEVADMPSETVQPSFDPKLASRLDDTSTGARHDALQPNDYVTFYPHARGGSLGEPSATGAKRTSQLLPTTRIGAAIAAAVAVLALQGLLMIGSSAPPHTASATNATAGAKGTTELSILELLAAAPVSPRGVTARDVGPIKALENAQAAMHAPNGTRDLEEAGFWLRRFLGTGGVDERSRRALTQLGSTFADQSSRSVDFVKARQVWELSSALGDPVAMCFLSAVHENGLSTTVDRKAALGWLERAKQAGGCPSIEESLSRLKL